MPELPEVETIRKELTDKLVKRTITSVEVRLAKPLGQISVEEFKERLTGVKVEGIRRRGKILIIDLSSSCSLLIHLKLTGRLLYLNPEEPVSMHTHIIFYLDNQMTLRFWDLRQFGYLKLVLTREVFSLPELCNFGPEPLNEDFTLADFRQLFKNKRQGRIKPLLLDQNFIAGIGNIYSDEICYLARVHPSRQISTLTDLEIGRLYESMRLILSAAIKYKGSSSDTYLDLYGKKGQYQFRLNVYGCQGQPCPECKVPIKRIKLAGRSAHFCPQCQC